jgi:hypothetical protein
VLYIASHKRYGVLASRPTPEQASQTRALDAHGGYARLFPCRESSLCECGSRLKSTRACSSLTQDWRLVFQNGLKLPWHQPAIRIEGSAMWSLNDSVYTSLQYHPWGLCNVCMYMYIDAQIPASTRLTCKQHVLPIISVATLARMPYTTPNQQHSPLHAGAVRAWSDLNDVHSVTVGGVPPPFWCRSSRGCVKNGAAGLAQEC